MKRVGNIILAILPILACYGIQIVVSVGTFIIYGFIQGFQLAAMGETDPGIITEYIMAGLSTEVLLLISAISAVLALVVFSIWYKQLIKAEERTDYSRVSTPKNLLAIVFMGIGLQIGITFILSILASLKPEWFESYGEVMEQLGMGNTLISTVYIGLIAPFSEEFIFRGVILKLAGRALPFTLANILQALLFGIYHGNLVQGIYAFIIGMFLGLVCYKIKTIAGSILLHMVINISGLLLQYVLTDQVLQIPGMVIILAGLSIAGIVYGTVMLTKQDEVDEFDLSNYR
jgi:membrane protease YdiL (CAAX protease family)